MWLGLASPVLVKKVFYEVLSHCDISDPSISLRYFDSMNITALVALHTI
jgi:hypothetical protein